MKTLEIWYEFGSNYSYLSVMRIEALAEAAGVEVVWRPFLLGPLLHAHQGMTDSPFNVVPIKGTITLSGYEGSELLVARLLIESGANVPYVGTACPKTPWSDADRQWLEANKANIPLT